MDDEFIIGVSILSLLIKVSVKSIWGNGSGSSFGIKISGMFRL
jgi:hypothetical protein